MPRRTRKPMIPLPPIAFGRAITRRRAIALGVTLVVAAVLVALDHQVDGPIAGDDWRRYHGQTYTVVRVVDGDTLILNVPDGAEATTRVRLWGVDTPEKAGPNGSRPAEPFADQATAFTRDLVDGQPVTITLEPHRLRGKYGRLLVYVELQDGSSLNQRLIEAGLSQADNRWSYARQDAFTRAQERARNAGRGMWADP